MRKADICQCKKKAQISCAVTAQLISTFVFTAWIVQFLFFLNPKFQASSHLLWVYRPVCVKPGRKLRRPVFLHWAQIIQLQIPTWYLPIDPNIPCGKHGYTILLVSHQQIHPATTNVLSRLFQFYVIFKLFEPY